MKFEGIRTETKPNIHNPLKTVFQANPSTQQQQQHLHYCPRSRVSSLISRNET
jgi:hypothetical protein